MVISTHSCCLIFNFQINNIVSIVESGQAMDNTLVAAAGKTCAVVIYDPPSTSSSDDDNNTTSIELATLSSFSVSLLYKLSLRRLKNDLFIITSK